MPDRIQRQRFENKYQIDEDTALKIRDYLSGYLTLDKFGATQPNYSYRVHSIYLDSPDFRTYKNTINGDRNRFKLRFRFYEDGDDNPFYAEIKRRFDKVIYKKRASLYRNALPVILNGHFPDKTHFTEPDEFYFESAEQFCRYVNHLQARPVAHVRYDREAWVTNDGHNKVRVTIDRNVYSEYYTKQYLTTKLNNPVSVFGNKRVLELKFTDRFPNWYRDLVQQFSLRQGSSAKYVDGIYNMGEAGILTHYI